MTSFAVQILFPPFLPSGSAFNETGPGTAGTVYAGNGVSATRAGSSNAVSQYDVACFQVSQSH